MIIKQLNKDQQEFKKCMRNFQSNKSSTANIFLSASTKSGMTRGIYSSNLSNFENDMSKSQKTGTRYSGPFITKDITRTLGGQPEQMD